jgi:hypothetical protein|tara:strand:- start:501 stop:896 length:396 start_codon:yes stop_codon:yes gene_type:complete
MPTFEINLWDNKRIIQKVVQEFDDEKQVQKYIEDNFDTQPDPEYPGLDPTRGYVRPKSSKYIITFAKVHTYVRKKGPSRIELTEKEKELQETLEKSITKEAIDEWGHNEMMRQVRKDYWGHPNATGLEDKK